MSVFDNMQDYILGRIMLDPGSGCWLWEGQISRHGYGQFRVVGPFNLETPAPQRSAHAETFVSLFEE